MPPVFWIGLGIAAFIFLVGVVAGARSTHRQPQAGRRDRCLPRRHVRLPAAGHRPRHQLAPRHPPRAAYSVPRSGSSPCGSETRQERSARDDRGDVDPHRRPCTTASRFPSSASASSRCRRRTPRRRSRRRWRPATATSTPPPPTATRRAWGRRSPPPGSPRDEVFVTTKLWNSEQGYDSTLGAFEKSLERLGLDHVDLYLIHWPVPTEDRYLDTWRAFERIYEEGGARSIGVSNFRVEDLERLEARGRGAADRQPDRAAPAPAAGRAARLARRARHRHRGLEPARPGRPARRRRRSSPSPPTTARPRPRRSCAGTCSSATSSSPSRSPRRGSARTSTSSTSS